MDRLGLQQESTKFCAGAAPNSLQSAQYMQVKDLRLPSTRLDEEHVYSQSLAEVQRARLFLTLACLSLQSAVVLLSSCPFLHGVGIIGVHQQVRP